MRFVMIALILNAIYRRCIRTFISGARIAGRLKGPYRV
jgi:hypothetical protein